MKRNNLGRFILVLVILIWAFSQAWPPGDQNVIDVFAKRAEKADTNFTAIVQQARKLEAAHPERKFANLFDAVGTNDLRPIFPSIDVSESENPNRAILSEVQREAAGKIKLGIDLQGGVSFVVQVDTNRMSVTSDRQSVLNQAMEVLRKRVDKFGVAEPIIQVVGEDRIQIQMPGLSEADHESVRSTLQKAAYLEFRMVHPDSKRLAQEGLIVPGYELLRMKEKRTAGGGGSFENLLVKIKPENGLTGKYVKLARMERTVAGEPEIYFQFNFEGAKIFGEVTKNHVNERMAIVLDGEVRSAPNINEPIMGGSGTISGSFDAKEANDLANVLENPLEVPVHIISENTVDPTLGTDAIQSGIRAAVIGTLAVSVFMACYYMLSGLVANVALLTNIVILLGVMCSVGTTLTLPGIAGIVLTVGMAVDANVLIYERIREELAKNKSLRGAIEAGYDRAFGTIFDSHVTTLISSVVLIYLGTGSVKGFGVALTIGVAASLFTALVVTRLIFDFIMGRNLITKLPMLHFIHDTKIDFMRFAKPAFITTWLLIIIGLGFGLSRGKAMLGVDFAGGDTTIFTLTQKQEVEKIRSAVTQLGEKDAQIQYQNDLSGKSETLRVTTSFGTGDKVKAALLKDFSSAGIKAAGTEKVGAVVGAEIQRSAIFASVVSLFFILVYVAFRYEFSFAVGAVVAVIHDVLMTIGCYCLANGVSGRQFNATMVAAVLTIIGFSINDTIVIFDRIREDLKMGVRGTFKQIMNQALNQTLSRTIITSGTVFLATCSLYIFGGGAINDFAFTFLVGIITGTYSSIYIASALVLWWHKGERPKIGSTPVAGGATSSDTANSAPARA